MKFKIDECRLIGRLEGTSKKTGNDYVIARIGYDGDVLDVSVEKDIQPAVNDLMMYADVFACELDYNTRFRHFTLCGIEK